MSAQKFYKIDFTAKMKEGPTKIKNEPKIKEGHIKK